MQGFSLDFGDVVHLWPVLARGLVATLTLAVTSLICGFALGLVIGLGRIFGFRPLRALIGAFVEVFRNTPALVQLIWFFYVVPAATGTTQSVFVSSAIALSLNCAAFSSEIFRGGIQSIHKGQWEAARAIGMHKFSTLYRVIFPQAFKRMIPALANRAIEVVKLTALAGTLGYAELLYQGQLISATLYRPIESYTMVAIVFVVVLGFFAAITRRLERRLSRNE